MVLADANGPPCRPCGAPTVWITAKWWLRRTWQGAGTFTLCPICDAPPGEVPTWMERPA